jgi:hypothetical protein
VQLAPRIIIGALFVLVTVVVVYILIAIWPTNGESGPISKNVIFGWTWTLDGDQRLVVLVVLSGALGGLVKSLVELGHNIGKRQLKWSYMMSYCSFPIIGATLGVVLYLVIRAGFVGFDKTAALNAYGYLALAVLGGLFAHLFLGKLRKVAEAFFEEGAPAVGEPGGDDD